MASCADGVPDERREKSAPVTHEAVDNSMDQHFLSATSHGSQERTGLRPFEAG